MIMESWWQSDGAAKAVMVMIMKEEWSLATKITGRGG